MEKIIIKIQSLVDVITNSSTEIYLQATDDTLKIIQDMVASFLENVLGEKYDVKDYIEIKLTYSSDIEITITNKGRQIPNLERFCRGLMRIKDSYDN